MQMFYIQYSLLFYSVLMKTDTILASTSTLQRVFGLHLSTFL